MLKLAHDEAATAARFQRSMHDRLMRLPVMATVAALRVHPDQRSLVRATADVNTSQ